MSLACFHHRRANSVTWNPHKMMSVPLQCSALLVREEVSSPPHPHGVTQPGVCVVSPPDSVCPQGLMQNCNQMHACYLFQQDKHYDLSYDTGDKALQCGRHVDIFKLWLMWRAKVVREELLRFRHKSVGKERMFFLNYKQHVLSSAGHHRVRGSD